MNTTPVIDATSAAIPSAPIQRPAAPQPATADAALSRGKRISTGIGLGGACGTFGGMASGASVITAVMLASVFEVQPEDIPGGILATVILWLFAAIPGGVIGLILGSVLGGLLAAVRLERIAPIVAAIAANFPHIAFLVAPVFVWASDDYGPIATSPGPSAGEVFGVAVSVVLLTTVGALTGRAFAKMTAQRNREC